MNKVAIFSIILWSAASSFAAEQPQEQAQTSRERVLGFGSSMIRDAINDNNDPQDLGAKKLEEPRTNEEILALYHGSSMVRDALDPEE